jgi:hypothetical protein
MERDRSVAALTLGAPVVDGIARELSAGCGPSPLVLAEAGQGPFRAAEARWVRPDGAVPVETVEQLRGLLAEWDGAPPSLPALRVAESGARATAASRVAEAVRRAGDVARKGLEDQVSAARLRLLRELGRTLRCSGPGDLGARFKERLQSEDRPTGRYHRCRDLLGGMPQWTPEETASIESYFAGLNSQQRNTRLLGSQLDAALNDPRWKAIQK